MASGDDIVVAQEAHVQQVFLNPGAGYQVRRDIGFERVLRPDAPRSPYRRRKDEVKTVIHWGQRKLLLAEIEFLTLCGDAARTVVYAGAAPGTHVRYLASLFPEHRFVLVDPAPFTARESERVTLRQELFTDELAREFSTQDVLFISDVRSADWTALEEDETEVKVHEDQQMQLRWVEIMRPQFSLLKFRLSYRPGQTEYLSGDIYLPVFGPITTTETRLLVARDAPRRLYDHKVYEEQLFYFNTVTRVALYPHPIMGEGLDHCYDCRAEVHILQQYCEKHQPDEDVNARVAFMSYIVSREVAHDRTLASPNCDPDERNTGMRNRQWIDGKPAYHVVPEAHATPPNPRILPLPGQLPPPSGPVPVLFPTPAPASGRSRHRGRRGGGGGKAPPTS